MEKTTEFIAVKENPTKFNNEILSDKIEILYQIRNNMGIVKEIFDANSDELKLLYPNYEEMEDFISNDDDIRNLAILEKIEELQMLDIKNMGVFAKELSTGFYFKTMQSGDCLYSSLMGIDSMIGKLNSAISNDRAVDYAQMSKELLNLLTNLNYSMVCMFRTFKVDEERFVCINFWEVKKNRNFKEFADMCNEYYAENKPNLGIFVKYPDLALKLEELLDEERFFELASLSEYAEYEELVSIASGLKEVNDTYILTLLDRREE